MVDERVGKPPLDNSGPVGGDRTVGIHQTRLKETGSESVARSFALRAPDFVVC